MNQDQTAPEPDKTLNFESHYQALQECVAKLESGQLSLDDALTAYQKGIALVQTCRETLNQAQARVEQILSIDEHGQSQNKPIDLDVQTTESLQTQTKSKPRTKESEDFF